MIIISPKGKKERKALRAGEKCGALRGGYAKSPPLRTRAGN